MPIADREIQQIMQRTRVARLATLSRTGRPSVNPLYFILWRDRIWLGTADWTLAARNVAATFEAVVLFESEGEARRAPAVRVRGRATVRIGRWVNRWYGLRVALRYVLTPAGIHNLLTHRHLLGLRRRYYAQSAARGRPCVIEVIPEMVELLRGRR